MSDTVQGIPGALGSYMATNPDAAIRWAGVVNSLAGGPRALNSVAPVTAAMVEYGMRPQRMDAFTGALQRQDVAKQNPYYGPFGEPPGTMSISQEDRETLARGTPRSSSVAFESAAKAVTQNAAEARAEKQGRMRSLPALPQVGSPPPQRPSPRSMFGPPGSYSQPSTSDQIRQLLSAKFPGYLTMQQSGGGGLPF